MKRRLALIGADAHAAGAKLFDDPIAWMIDQLGRDPRLDLRSPFRVWHRRRHRLASRCVGAPHAFDQRLVGNRAENLAARVALRHMLLNSLSLFVLKLAMDEPLQLAAIRMC